MSVFHWFSKLVHVNVALIFHFGCLVSCWALSRTARGVGIMFFFRILHQILRKGLTKMWHTVSIFLWGSLEPHWDLPKTVGPLGDLGEFFGYFSRFYGRFYMRIDWNGTYCLNFSLGQSGVPLGSSKDRGTSWRARRILCFVFFSNFTADFT